MRMFTQALGVRCTYCHVGRDGMPLDSVDFVSDAKPTKETARDMMRLTGAINVDVERIRVKPAGMNTSALRVSCATCHRGAPRPVTLEDTLRRIADAQGVDSAVAAYRALRTRYHGRYTFDFSERPLGDLAASYGRGPQAQRFLELNAELFPENPGVLTDLGRFYEQTGDKARAIEQYRKVMKAQPNNRQVQQRLRTLGDTTVTRP
jgi:Flp pilus assembly protein TadD